MLRMQLLGPIRLLNGEGEPLTLPQSRKSRALLAYLAVTGRPQRRDRLCDLFWDMPDDPRGALRWCLSRLRSILDEPGSTRLIADRDTVSLAPEAITLDLLAVRKLLGRGVDAISTDELIDAASAFHGEVLAELDLPDRHTYQSWVVGLREDTRQLRSRVLRQLTTRLAEAPERALPYARDLVDLDSRDEAAWAELVRLLVAAGRWREAEEQHETATNALKESGGASGPLLKAWRELRRKVSSPPPIESQRLHIEAISSDPSTRQSAASPAAQADRAGLPPSAERKPSIVVLPFANLSGEPDTEYFSYGLTEDIIRLLARHRWLVVLSRHSGVAYKSGDFDPREIGVVLGVRYLVQGSVLRRGERVRLTADLICAETRRQLWSETYNFVLADILDVQDAMAQQIAATIEPELARFERESAMRKLPRNLDAWDLYQRGLWHLWGFSRPGFAEAETMFLRAIELEPEFARAHGALAYVKVQASAVSEPSQREAMLRDALRIARTAVGLDDADCMNQCVLGRAQCMLGEFEEAIAALQQAISLNPSFAQGYFALGHVLVLAGREEEAIELLERATELSPRDPHLWSFHHVRALAHFSLGEVERAAELARRACRLPNAPYRPFATLSASLGLLGLLAEAKASVTELLEREPAYDERIARADLKLEGEKFIARYLEGLRRANAAILANVSG